MTHDFAGTFALVTGAASGMGLATAGAFAKAGAAVRGHAGRPSQRNDARREGPLNSADLEEA